MDDTPNLKYCLYARKSSESDERQAMSIDSQIKEMKELADKEGLDVLDVRKESYSAKDSGKRPVFMKLLNDIQNQRFNSILTWSPDRLSRNAGDLGMIVDLMDQKKLLQIKTNSQVFSDNPNEKFLLMILCSQAKLENDNKGIHVKRGIRAKCEMGWRPGPAPIGYFNKSYNGVKQIAVDKEVAHFITKMFEKVADGASGRDIKRWADKVGFTNKSGKPLSLSQIYKMLKDPFYYGEFEYGNEIYEGAHKPLISKKLFKKVREQMKVPEKAEWGSKNILFRGLFKCGSCKGSITGTKKVRERKNRKPKTHVYYSCPKIKDSDCPEESIKEGRLISELMRYINFMTIAHPQKINLTEKVEKAMEKYKKIQDQVLLQKDINPNSTNLTFKDYAKYALREGSKSEKREIVKTFEGNLYIHNKKVYSSSIK